jgi:hypothetical protein
LGLYLLPVTQGLDENISRKLKLLRVSLQISAIDHAYRAAKSKALVKAIDEFLGDRPNGSKEPAPPEYGLLTDAIRSILFALGDKEFSIETVEKGLAAINGAPAADRQGISVALWKMADRGELEIVERGAGRKPTIYKVRQLQIVRHKRT